MATMLNPRTFSFVASHSALVTGYVVEAHDASTGALYASDSRDSSHWPTPASDGTITANFADAIQPQVLAAGKQHVNMGLRAFATGVDGSQSVPVDGPDVFEFIQLDPPSTVQVHQ